jgi:hypothetical protein
MRRRRDPASANKTTNTDLHAQRRPWPSRVLKFVSKTKRVGGHFVDHRPDRRGLYGGGQRRRWKSPVVDWPLTESRRAESEKAPPLTGRLHVCPPPALERICPSLREKNCIWGISRMCFPLLLSHHSPPLHSLTIIEPPSNHLIRTRGAYFFLNQANSIIPLVLHSLHDWKEPRHERINNLCILNS